MFVDSRNDLFPILGMNFMAVAFGLHRLRVRHSSRQCLAVREGETGSLL